jgi:uncharacterized protein
MNKTLRLTLALTAALAISIVGFNLCHGAMPTNPTGFVTDTAGVLDQDVHNRLEANLRTFEKATGTEIAVVTVQSLEGMSVEEYANKLFHSWGIGKRTTNNGVLLLVALSDHKMRIEVGYGLEEKLNDGAAGEIIRGMVPSFRAHDFNGGISHAVYQIEGRVK